MMKRLASLLLLWAPMIALPAGIVHASGEMAFDSAPVDDAALAGSYGKFLAPGGIDLAMSVQSDTAVNGNLVLRSVFTVDQGPATLQIYAPAPGATGPAIQVGAGQTQSAPENPGLSITFDRTGGGKLSVSPASGSASWMPNVTVGNVQAQARSSNDGLVAVEGVVGGPAVQAGAGAVSAATSAGGFRITYNQADLSISHLAGDATGSVVANSADNRVIDTVTTVSIDVRNADVLTLASSQLRADDIATAATGAMLR